MENCTRTSASDFHVRFHFCHTPIGLANSVRIRTRLGANSMRILGVLDSNVQSSLHFELVRKSLFTTLKYQRRMGPFEWFMKLRFLPGMRVSKCPAPMTKNAIFRRPSRTDSCLRRLTVKCERIIPFTCQGCRFHSLC